MKKSLSISMFIALIIFSGSLFYLLVNEFYKHLSYTFVSGITVASLVVVFITNYYERKIK